MKTSLSTIVNMHLRDFLAWDSVRRKHREIAKRSNFLYLANFIFSKSEKRYLIVGFWIDSVTDNYYQDSQSSTKTILASKWVSYWKSALNPVQVTLN